MEVELITRARSGDLDAWIEACLANVRYMAWSFSQSSGIDAEDLLQEVALKLFLKSDKVLAKHNPMTYAKVLARNAMIDQYRKVARRRRRAWVMSLERCIHI